MTVYYGSNITQTYFVSPHDFTVEVLTRDTLKLSGLPWEPTVEYFVSIDVMRAKSKRDPSLVVVKTYTAATHAFAWLSRDTTLQVKGADFHKHDSVRVSMMSQKKAYCVAGDYTRSIDVNPVAREELVELKCTGCGGTLERPQAGGSVQCEYCGKPYYLGQVGS